MIVLAYGAWDYDDPEYVENYMTRLDKSVEVDVMVANGDDRIGSWIAKWAKPRMIPVERIYCDFNRWGREAPDMRNQQALEIYRPDLIVAFVRNLGYDDMSKRCLRSRLNVVVAN